MKEGQARSSQTQQFESLGVGGGGGGGEGGIKIHDA